MDGTTPACPTSMMLIKYVFLLDEDRNKKPVGIHWLQSVTVGAAADRPPARWRTADMGLAHPVTARCGADRACNFPYCKQAVGLIRQG